ncbi:S-adenosyl-L-methionine-dependent methyltransferase [Fusarium avenaceum]|nr:S-adenosyl-L-methionine-dependent methyltransferase [Fusarium avenaceum]
MEMSSPVSGSTLDKGQVTLTGAQETLLITLFARAKDAESPNPVLNDQHSVQVVRRIRYQGYNFSRTTLDRSDSGFFTSLVATRARVLDICCERFLERNPGPATIIHLACGMDARSLRLKWQGEGRLWIDADRQDVVKLRRQIMDDPASGRGEYILTDPNIHDDMWLRDYNVPTDRPVLILFEGLTPYLTREEVVGLLMRIVKHFHGSGVNGEIRFDAPGSISYFLINYVFNKPLRSMGTQFTWYMDDPRELETHVPGLKYKERMFVLHDYARLGNYGWLASFILRVADWFNVGGRIGSGYGYEF